jgi:hypothetical protein
MKTRGGWRSRNPMANALAAAIAVLLVAVWVPRGGATTWWSPSRLRLLGIIIIFMAWRRGCFSRFVCLGARVVIAIARRLKAESGEKTDYAGVLA